MLDDARGQIRELEPYRLAHEALRLDRHPRVPLDRHEHALQREAALVVGEALVARLDEPRVHEHDRVLVRVRLDDYDAPQDADLRRREPDALRVHHQALHPLDEPPEVAVEVLHLVRAHAQGRVAELADLRERRAPSRLALRIALFVALLAHFALYLAHRGGQSIRDVSMRRNSARVPLSNQKGVFHMDVWTYREESVGDIDLAGFSVEANDGGIGKIDEATYDVGGSYLVVDTGPWIFGRKSVLPAGVVERIDPDAETVFVSLTKDQIKNAPELDDFQGRLEDTHREQLGSYYDEPAATRSSDRF